MYLSINIINLILQISNYAIFFRAFESKPSDGLKHEVRKTILFLDMHFELEYISNSKLTCKLLDNFWIEPNKILHLRPKQRNQQLMANVRSSSNRIWYGYFVVVNSPVVCQVSLRHMGTGYSSTYQIAVFHLFSPSWSHIWKFSLYLQ
jgi:hypothetical protein